MSRLEVNLAGFGGQGIILASYIVGKAATLYDRKNAVQSQSYGPEARGGACSAGVVISEEKIDYPFVQIPDILILMSQEACTTYSRNIKKDTLILIDEDLVRIEDPRPGKILAIPATRMAESLQRRIVANIVMLGFFASVTGVVSREAMEKSIGTSVPAPTVELNLKAFNMGYEYGRELLKGKAASEVKL